MNTSSARRRILARQQAECRVRRTLVELLCAVSVLRTGLTQVLPLAGTAAWWVTLAAMLPGTALLLAARLMMHRTGAGTLPELVRRRLGRPGLWGLCAVLTVLLLADAVATLTALTAFFAEGVGTRGTPLTLAILTAAALLPCLHREGLPRAVHLLRWVLLAAAVTAGALLLPACRADHLYPMSGAGMPAVWAALRSASGAGWPLLLLLTLPAEGSRPVSASLARVTLAVLLPLLIICLTIPQEVLASRAGLAETLLLPGRYAPAGLQMLLHCLLLICLFLAIGGALHLAGEVACAPLSRPVRWLPHAALTLLTLTQLLRRETLRQALAALSFRALLLLAAVVLLFIPARRRRP